MTAADRRYDHDPELMGRLKCDPIATALEVNRDEVEPYSAASTVILALVERLRVLESLRGRPALAVVG